MNTSTLSGKWNEVKGLLMEKYGNLTQDDLTRAQGDVNRLVGIVQQKTGRARDEIERFLDESFNGAHGAAQRFADSASEYASDASEYARRSYDQMSEAAQEGYLATRRLVQRSPLESLAVAFGIGAAIGVVAAFMMQPPRR